MTKQNLKELWIPAEILLNEELSDKEKIVLSIILYLSETDKNCFASNQYIANIINVSSNRVSRIISKLKEKQYIKVVLKYKNDCKEIEERQIIPIDKNNKDIINKIKNKNNDNKVTHISNNVKSNYKGRDYKESDFTKLYANSDVFVLANKFA